MAARAPPLDGYDSVPAPSNLHAGKGYGLSSNPPDSHLSVSAPDFDLVARGHPAATSPLAQSAHAQPPSALAAMSDYAPDPLSSTTPSRSGTLKKKNSLSRRGSLKRTNSRKSIRAGSIKGVPSSADLDGDVDDFNNVFHTPVPTQGTPTDVLANRFQAWRKFLKDLVTYFREVQKSYETRANALLKVSNVINNTNAPTIFLSEGGLNEANRILRDYHKQAIVEANKARDIENDVVLQLNGLRADLNSKIKEIKGLAGDFKNSVDKEREGTRRAVDALAEALRAADIDPSVVVGKGDPYVVRLAVDRQVERQIDEENYLHRAYLNLENSGRELEAIVVGEIQKAYNTLAGILKRDADSAYDTVERLRVGPVAMHKDLEWSAFINRDPHFVSPSIPLRKVDEIEYPGKNHPSAQEVRAGTLERKGKYLKSYTPGWYVLSPTHLHEFKSPDYIYTQPPVMSLCLLEQKLGSHSQPGGSSHKFSLKGKQTGGMHRGHSWVFRAESYETMMAWYNDIRALTEGTGEQRTAFVRKHARSMSAGASSISGDSGLEEDEADEIPYSANASQLSREATREEEGPRRPQPGGRFPSDIQVNGHLRAPLSPSSGSDDFEHERHGGQRVEMRNSQHEREVGHGPSTSHYETGRDHAPGQSYYEQNDYFQLPPSQQYHADERLASHGQTDGIPNAPSGAATTGSGPHSSQHHHGMAPLAPTAAAYPSEQLQGYPKAVTPSADPISVPSSATTANPSRDWVAPTASGAALAGTTLAYKQQDHERSALNPSTQAQLNYTSTAPRVVATSVDAPSLPLDPPPPHPLPSTDPLLASTTLEHDRSRPTTSGTVDTLGSSVGGVPFGATAAGVGVTEADTFANAHSASIFPGVKRKDTDISVSNLHIPGEYPKGTLGLGV